MSALRAAYRHIHVTRSLDKRIVYGLCVMSLVGMSIWHSWVIGAFAAFIFVVAVPLFVYNDENVTRRSCRREPDRKVPSKGIARAAGG